MGHEVLDVNPARCVRADSGFRFGYDVGVELRVVEDVGEKPESEFPGIAVDGPVEDEGGAGDVRVGEGDFPLFGFDCLEELRNFAAGGGGEGKIGREGGEDFALGDIAGGGEGGGVVV